MARPEGDQRMKPTNEQLGNEPQKGVAQFFRELEELATNPFSNFEDVVKAYQAFLLALADHPSYFAEEKDKIVSVVQTIVLRWLETAEAQLEANDIDAVVITFNTFSISNPRTIFFLKQLPEDGHKEISARVRIIRSSLSGETTAAAPAEAPTAVEATPFNYAEWETDESRHPEAARELQAALDKVDDLNENDNSVDDCVGVLKEIEEKADDLKAIVTDQGILREEVPGVSGGNVKKVERHLQRNYLEKVASKVEQAEEVIFLVILQAEPAVETLDNRHANPPATLPPNDTYIANFERTIVAAETAVATYPQRAVVVVVGRLIQPAREVVVGWKAEKQKAIEANTDFPGFDALVEVVALRTETQRIEDIDVEQDIHAEHGHTPSYVTADLEGFAGALQTAKQAAENNNVLVVTHPTFLVGNKVVAQKHLEALLSRIKQSETKIQGAIEKSKEPKPVSRMSYLEIIAEIRDKGLDISDHNFGTAMNEGRQKELVIAYNQKVEPDEPKYTDKEKLENLVAQTEYLLSRLNAKLYFGDGSVARDRSQLFDKLNNYSLTRPNLLMCTTYHPVWGAQLREALQYLVLETAADKPGAKNTTYCHYESFCGSKGNEFLGKALTKYLDDKGLSGVVREKVDFFAKMLFANFDMLSIILGELQMATRTRAHNGGLKMTDPVALENPVGSYVHNGYRYHNPKDWRAWYLLFFQDIDPSDPRWQSASKRGSGEIPARALGIQERQRLVKAHQNAFVDIRKIGNKVGRDSYQLPEIPGPCESVFPNTLDLLLMEPDREVLHVLDQGNIQYSKSGTAVDAPDTTTIVGGNEYVEDWEKYKIAKDGWEKLITIALKGLNSNLTLPEIVESHTEGQKGGLLYKWISTAGAAKVFYPKHLRMLFKPMLMHYCFRLMSHFVGDTPEARDHLRREMIKALKNTKTEGGLSMFDKEMDDVIEVMQGKDFIGLPINRLKYWREYMRMYWRSENHSEPPMYFAGINMKSWVDPDAEREEFIAVCKGEMYPPLPATREGSLISKDK